MFHLGSDLKLGFREYVTLLGNVLDVAIWNDPCMIIYSLDNFHLPFSTTVPTVTDDHPSRHPIGSLTLDNFGHWKQRPILQDALAATESEMRSTAGLLEQGTSGGVSLGSLFYGIENLRKRGQDEPE